MKFKIILLALVFLMVAALVYAANTLTPGQNVQHITDIDSDWSWTDRFPHLTAGVRVSSIQFNPGASDDVCVIKDGSDTGATIFPITAEHAYDQYLKPFDCQRMRPVLDYSAGTYSSGAEVVIIFCE